MVTSEIREYQQSYMCFVQILIMAREIIEILTKRNWNYSLISRISQLITYQYHGSLITLTIVGFWRCYQIDSGSRTPRSEHFQA